METTEENILEDSVTYFFPGMAASDIMFFKYRNLPFNCHFFNWIDPLPKENMTAYAARYVKMMDLSKKVNLVGVSFGGILAVEIAKQIEINKIVLISSMPSRRIFPSAFRFFKLFPLYKLIPAKKPPLNRKVIKRIFGIQREEDLDFFIKMISEYNFKNLKWSVEQLIQWNHNQDIPGLIHIIGDKDKLFKPGSSANEIVIKGGTHYMVVDRAREVKDALIEALKGKD